jgi:hypothetical protein
MRDEEPQEDRLAKHRAIVAMLELSRKIANKDCQLKIDADKPLEPLFYIEGRLNNFYFKYGVDSYTTRITLKSTEDTIDITTRQGISPKIEQVNLNGTDYNTTSIFHKDLQNTFQQLEDMITGDSWKHTEPTGLLLDKLNKGELPDLKDLDEHEITTAKAIYRGYKILTRIRREIQENVPEFFEIAKKYFNQGYHPTDSSSLIFKTSEEVFNEFDLS